MVSKFLTNEQSDGATLHKLELLSCLPGWLHVQWVGGFHRNTSIASMRTEGIIRQPLTRAQGFFHNGTLWYSRQRLNVQLFSRPTCGMSYSSTVGVFSVTCMKRLNISQWVEHLTATKQTFTWHTHTHINITCKRVCPDYRDGNTV